MRARYLSIHISSRASSTTCTHSCLPSHATNISRRYFLSATTTITSSSLSSSPSPSSSSSSSSAAAATSSSSSRLLVISPKFGSLYGLAAPIRFFASSSNNKNSSNDDGDDHDDIGIDEEQRPASKKSDWEDNEYRDRDDEFNEYMETHGKRDKQADDKFERDMLDSYTKTLRDYRDEYANKNRLRESGYQGDDFLLRSSEKSRALTDPKNPEPDFFNASIADRLTDTLIRRRDRGAQGINLDEPPPRERIVDERGVSKGIGRRKTAIAVAYMKKGTGNILVNGQRYVDYFGHWAWAWEMTRPFQVTDSVGQYDVICKVRGGGKSGQVGACRLAIARALQHQEPEHRVNMKADGLMTRDSRKVQRKHFGRKKARKSFTFVKR